MNCTAGGISPLYFTGKQRDTETGLDYFGARYNASNLGRFMTPDWSAKIEPVPYAKLADPQSLNLYTYVLDNPVTLTDADGHTCRDRLSCMFINLFRPSTPPVKPSTPQVGPSTPPAHPLPAYVPGKLPPAADPGANAAKGRANRELQPRDSEPPDELHEYPPAQVEPPPTLVPGQNSPAPIGTVPASTPEINPQNLSFGKRLILGIVSGLRTWPGATDFVFAVIPRPLYRPQDPKLCLNGCVM